MLNGVVSSNVNEHANNDDRLTIKLAHTVKRAASSLNFVSAVSTRMSLYDHKTLLLYTTDILVMDRFHDELEDFVPIIINHISWWECDPFEDTL